MGNLFDFSTASQIVFGNGAFTKTGQLVEGFGQKAFVVTGFRGTALDELRNSLAVKGITVMAFAVQGEPKVDTVIKGVQEARAFHADMVLGLGGGSALDSAKAIAALMTNPGEPLDYLEVVGRNQPLVNRPAPFVAIPTTAGTGSEVTRNAVLAVPEKKVKVSLRSSMMLARIAIVDPELTYSLPEEITASTGMDALTQVIEPYVSSRANWMTDLYCREGIKRSARSLIQAYRHGDDRGAREDLSFTSLMGGLALANAGLGAVHGFAGPIGGMYDAPHGSICAALLPTVVEINARALAEREYSNPALARYGEVAKLVLQRADATIADLVNWLRTISSQMKIPGLKEYGITGDQLAPVVEKGMAASSMKANPIRLTEAELKEILEMSL